MSETLFFIVICICLVAVVVETLKKSFSVGTDDGRLKTILSKSVIISVALILSSIVVVICYLADVLYGNNPLIMALYIPVVFVGQWFVDMKVVKKIFEKVLTRI